MIDNYGTEETIDFAISAADLGGRIVLMASQLDSIDDKLGVRPMPVFAKHISIIGTRASTQWEQETVIRLAAKGQIAMPIAHELPFDRIQEAHELQERGDFVGKVVLTL